jgi:hypothetical protein
MSSKLQVLWDALFWLIPFSLVGAVFGDAIRRDALTPRQRVAAGLFSLMVGPLAGAAAMREWGWSDMSALVVAAVAPTVAYDAIGLVASILRAAKDDPRGWLAVIKDALPWGRKP